MLDIDGPGPPEVVVGGVVNGLLAVQLALLHLGLLVDVGLLHPGESQYNDSYSLLIVELGGKPWG